MSARAGAPALAAILAAGVVAAQNAVEIIPRLDDVRMMRQYPEQPPIISHSIECYQLSVNTNRCLSCHRRETTAGSGAPMIYDHPLHDPRCVDARRRLAPVLLRRVPCAPARVVPLVPNTFVDMSDLGAIPAGTE